eukprot:TRINITY_DN212_c0_g1_i1.p1 TRINITY_DN212_c0_g1~~TRINITY_DN212_c0_g1_i1.p1  ORF type:complete len:192 (-),score=45.82 TRINITY_DN212_c0_g1_i1:51-626(-)
MRAIFFAVVLLCLSTVAQCQDVPEDVKSMRAMRDRDAEIDHSEGEGEDEMSLAQQTTGSGWAKDQLKKAAAYLRKLKLKGSKCNWFCKWKQKDLKKRIAKLKKKDFKEQGNRKLRLRKAELSLRNDKFKLQLLERKAKCNRSCKRQKRKLGRYITEAKNLIKALRLQLVFKDWDVLKHYSVLRNGRVRAVR